jgi:hypothetical protein
MVEQLLQNTSRALRIVKFLIERFCDEHRSLREAGPVLRTNSEREQQRDNGEGDVLGAVQGNLHTSTKNFCRD